MNLPCFTFYKKTILLFLCCLSIITHAQDWSQIAKITADVRTEDDLFGRSVAISGNYAVVGGLDNSTAEKAGAAYIFHNDAGTWKFVKKLTADPQVAGEEFGISVAISGDYVVVGSYKDDEDANEENPLADAGSIYIYGKDVGTGWGLIKKIVPTDREAGDVFGFTVAISGNYVVVGAPHFDLAGSFDDAGIGAVYVFHKDSPTSDSWGFVKKITAESAKTAFGFAVAIDGLQLIVGAPGEGFTPEEPNPQIETAGVAYFFKNDGSTPDNWALQTKLTAIVPTESGVFGWAVSISGNRAVVGTPFENGWQGAAYLCTGDGTSWTTVRKFSSPTLLFGISVSIYDDNVLIGTTYDGTDANGLNSIQQAGAVYLYNKDHLTENNWGLVKKIVSADRETLGLFGGAVAFSGNYFIVGATGNSTDAEGNNPLDDGGAAYIFADLTALPVTLVNFEAIKSEEHALLRWTTSSETNTGYFEVQKSRDARNWVAIGKTPASKESNQLLPYSYSDNNPFDGANYYRLKMVDQDETFAYSRIQSIHFDFDAALYPNPVSDVIQIKNLDLNTVRSIHFYNSKGILVLESNMFSPTGLDVTKIASGIYVADLTYNNGSVKRFKIVKN